MMISLDGELEDTKGTAVPVECGNWLEAWIAGEMGNERFKPGYMMGTGTALR